jgi:hypothetical protein
MKFDLLFYQLKNEKGEIYELRFWQKDLFEVTLPNGEVIHATWEIGEFEGNPFPNYENGDYGMDKKAINHPFYWSDSCHKTVPVCLEK